MERAPSPPHRPFEFRLWRLGWGRGGRRSPGPSGWVLSSRPIFCTSHPPPPICFLQFVKSVIIFLGAFLLFFKCKIYLYSVFKVVKKNNHENQTKWILWRSVCWRRARRLPFPRWQNLLTACGVFLPLREARRTLVHTHTHPHMRAHTCGPAAPREASAHGVLVPQQLLVPGLQAPATRL